jgi:hypothetical protein
MLQMRPKSKNVMKTIFTTTDISEKLEQKLDTPANLSAKIVSQMHAGIAHFMFVKKDGTVREAYGTLNKDILETYLGPQEEETLPTEPVPDSTQVFQKFYEISAPGDAKKKWRQYSIDSLVCLY